MAGTQEFQGIASIINNRICCGSGDITQDIIQLMGKWGVEYEVENNITCQEEKRLIYQEDS